MRLATWVEVALLISAFIAGIIGVGITARLTLAAIGPHPAIAQTVFLTIASAGGIGGLIVFWFLVARVKWVCRGYRVGFRQGGAYYEERDDSGRRWELAFQWFPLTEGYRPRGVVRLPRHETLDGDARTGAGGRLAEIALRIATDLCSYEGWPASVMPETTIEAAGHADVGGALIRAVLDECPEWAPHATSEPEADGQDRVLLSVPSPAHPSHRLEVVHRGEMFEIAHDCGQPGLRATASFGLADSAAAVFCACEFLRELREGEMVVLVRRLDLLTRRRAGGARYDAQFRSVSPSVRYSPGSVYASRTERSQNAG